jgi:hypothetical protein
MYKINRLGTPLPPGASDGALDLPHAILDVALQKETD